MTEEIEVYAEVVDDTPPNYDTLIRQALEAALEVQGTMINDLQLAINVLRRHEHMLLTLGAADPQEKNVKYLISKYNMNLKELNEKQDELNLALYHARRLELEA